jgi:hypothetical protein
MWRLTGGALPVKAAHLFNHIFCEVWSPVWSEIKKSPSNKGFLHVSDREQRSQRGKLPRQRFDATRVHDGSMSEKNSRSDDEILRAAAKRRIPEHG